MLLDDMGLGKTLQALLAAPPSSPVLVVCPRVARGVWEAEARKIRPDLKVTQLRPGGFRWPSPYELVIMTYETVPESWELPVPPRGAVLIVDEAHNVRNSSSSRYKRIKALREEVTVAKGRAYLLTATPLENRPPDLWNLACLLGVEKEAFGTRKNFNALFAYQGSRSWGLPLPGAAEALRAVALRRVKSEVQSQIPGKVIQIVPVEIELSRDEQGLADLAETWLAADSRDLGFEHMMRARAMLAKKKIPAMLELVEDLEAVGEQTLVFSSHRTPVEALASRKGWAAITGETSAEERTRLGTEFQAGRLFGLALTTGAGGTALTLTAAAHVVFVEREWNPSRNLQAEDRAVRIGQDKLVTIHRLIAEGTLDERVEEIIEEKTLSISGSVEAM
jgi:SNF2 family DNA or RNA helicase